MLLMPLHVLSTKKIIKVGSKMKLETIEQCVCCIKIHIENNPCELYKDIQVSCFTKKEANNVQRKGVSIRFDKVGCVMNITLPIESKELIKDFDECIKNHKSEAFSYSNLHELISDFTKVKQKLVGRLYNKKCGFEVTYDVPNSTYNDLCIVPYIELSKEATVRITPQLLELWKKQGVTDDMILYHCLHNVENDVKIWKLADDGERQMVVITNLNKCYGAISILFCEDELHEILGDDIIIIPSSVHEVIAVPAMSEAFAQLNSFIQQTNKKLVEKHEILSNHYYTI